MSKKSVSKFLRTFFFDDIINIKDLGPDNTQIYKKFCKNILINYIEYVTPKCTRLLYLATNTILLDVTYYYYRRKKKFIEIGI